ncbi:protein NDUFAF4 homolog [Vanessa tameamea]|uniref:Protein NDUFAF4 homolog n=1 Tax=Vanessa tameamea TaxID=334116 RepID=A0A8B8IQH6_VANTA
MGALVSKALRPIKSFNIENRAHQVISKEKPEVAPRYPSTAEELKRVHEIDPELDSKLDKKDTELDARLKDVYVTSYGKPEDDVTKEKQQKGLERPLPQNRGLVPDFDFGLMEPAKIPYGKTTLRHAIDYISSHQVNPEEVTAAKIAHEYKMKEEDVENILKYFRTYDVYLPETKQAPAVFAGPSELRKQLYKSDVKKIVGKSSTEEEKPEQIKNVSN